MNGKFNIDVDKMCESLHKYGISDRESFKQYFENHPKIVWSEEANEEFRIASEILIQNQKDCEQFKGRDGI